MLQLNRTNDAELSRYSPARGTILFIATLVSILSSGCSQPIRRSTPRPDPPRILKPPPRLGLSNETPRRPTLRHERPIIRVTPKFYHLTRLHLLEKVHPTLQAKSTEFVRRCWQKGLKVRIISGYRRYHKRRIRDTARNRKRRMWASWHNWGLGVDFSFIRPNGRTESIRGIRRGDRRWDRAGKIAKQVGLFWGGDFRGTPDKPHLEWHPGYPNLINYYTLQKLLRSSRPGGTNYFKVWRWFKKKNR